jgi:hypothetical protein
MRRRGFNRFIAGASVALAAYGCMALAPVPVVAPTVVTTPSRASVTVTPSLLGVSQLELGITHTQYTLDAGSTAAASSAGSVLRNATQLAAQHIMGWGALSPEPSPGRFQWQTLDRRVRLMTASSAQPVITLCCSPDWMKGGAAGATDWSKLETAPLPSHYQDFARLAATVAARYPTVRDFQVWNELKGFWDTRRNTWNIEAYTQMYNAVYTAVKRVRPDARIGGPYLPITSFSSWATASNPSAISGDWGILDQRALTSLDYFIRHAVGADFIVVDGSSSSRDGTLWTDPFSANRKFAAVTTWLRSRTALPVWWAEYYPQPAGQRWAQDGQAAVHADALIGFATSGASAVFLWDPNQDAASPTTRAALWTDVRAPGGGKATPTAAVYTALRQVAKKGTPLYRVITTGPVSALASATHVLLVNRAATPISVLLSGRNVDLGPYGVQVRPHP